MGRKIPSKKHRGVKDPLKQQAQRLQSIKHKINAPPTDPDDQPVPRSLQRLFAFQEKSKPSVTNKKKKPKRLGSEGGGRDDNPVAALRRLPGEAARAFSMRINSAVRSLHHPDEDYYPLDLEETDTRGEYIASQRERRQRKHRKAQRAAGEAAGAGPGAGEGGDRLRKAQRRALKKKEIRKAKEAEAAEALSLSARELRYERVAFGELAHAPPALPAPRMRADNTGTGAPRPGRRDLLLSKLLCAGARAGAPRAGGGGPQLLADRKELARLAAVDAYRQLKKQRAAAAGHGRRGP